MAVELTEAEQAKERRAEEIEKDLLEDFDEFSTWLKDEFSLTNQAVIVHAYIVNNQAQPAGFAITKMYQDYCRAKSWEQAGGEV